MKTNLTLVVVVVHFYMFYFIDFISRLGKVVDKEKLQEGIEKYFNKTETAENKEDDLVRELINTVLNLL